MHRRVSALREGVVEDDDDDAAPRPPLPGSVLEAIGEAVGPSAEGRRGGAEAPRQEDVLLATPYLLRPLLTVYAGCLPRREAEFGGRLDEGVFWAARQPLSPTVETVEGSPASSSASSLASTRPRPSSGAFWKNPLSDEEVYAVLKKRGIPTMPRHSTRVTVLIEHNEMEPVDLLLLAEINTARKEGVTSANKAYSGVQDTTGGPKMPRIYCLIVDGGEC
ncbi:unnamed protein product [Phytomonas sp. EM1]|nr:unnamed protein product [Phytomonas sp. EM1]|eukprot:CCW60581.1 unnamed protein product [Phytomonas sp. isolate EM1]